MQDIDIIEQCKRKAKQIKRDYPDKGYMQRLDVAARLMGYQHYTDLQRGGDQSVISLDSVRKEKVRAKAEKTVVAAGEKLKW